MSARCRGASRLRTRRLRTVCTVSFHALEVADACEHEGWFQARPQIRKFAREIQRLPLNRLSMHSPLVGAMPCGAEVALIRLTMPAAQPQRTVPARRGRTATRTATRGESSMDTILEFPVNGRSITSGASYRDEGCQGRHAQAFRAVEPGDARADQPPCCFVATLATRPSRRRLAVGRAPNGEPILAAREPVSTTRCASEPSRSTRLRTRAAGSRRRAVLAFHSILARR